MSLVNTINFLPTVFQSVTNQRFLGATLDQLTTGAVNIPVNGYIGRTLAPTYKFSDNYVPESVSQRKHYQLEASVVVKTANQEIEFNAGYIDLLNSINRYNGITNNHQRLFSAESYSYDGRFDYDKFVNYYNYFWLPNGPEAVGIYANQTPYNKDFTVTRNTDLGGYIFSGQGTHPNLQLTLARGGTYTFEIKQPGVKFWIQSQTGVSGQDPNISTVSTREVFGVTNNGTDNGKITFKVPDSAAQEFYYAMPSVSTVDAAVILNYTDVQGQLLSEFLTTNPLGFDGLNNQLQNKTVVFINNAKDDIFWTVDDVVVPTAQRTGIWKITLVPTGSDYTIKLLPVLTVKPKEKVYIGSGKNYAANSYWLDNAYTYRHVPIITANKDYLYYQDDANPDFVGVIKLVDNKSVPINITKDILGQIGYTSPNGVVFTNGLKVVFDNSVVPSTYANSEFYVEGVGTGITLIPVEQLTVPEDFAPLINTSEDYITISRAGADLNPWTRSNRWFHRDVIDAVAAYNNTVADYGTNLQGRRPIIEFEANLKLMNYGRRAKNKINYIVLDATDAFNEVEGQITASIDGHLLKNGDRVVFANDFDTTITNEVWEVEIRRINNTNYVTLIETPDDPVNAEENVLVTDGTHAGKTFKYDGSGWVECQSKTGFNQNPLFDLVDADGYSFSDTTIYPATTFTGTKFFGYKVGNGSNDVVLGFPLTYQNFDNIGDIVFTNYYDTESFTYTVNHVDHTVKQNSGYLSKTLGLTESARLNNWVVNQEQTQQFQIFTKFYDGFVLPIDGVNKAYVQVDILPAAQTTVPYIKVYLNNKLLTINVDYELTTYNAYNVVLLTAIPEINDKIDVAIFSDKTSSIGYYEIPENLDRNPLNENFDVITLGQLRNHYNKLIENTSTSSTGAIPLQDNYLKNHTGTLIQHSSPVIYAMTFLNDPLVNFVDSLTLARKEYQKFKNKFLSLCSTLTALDYKDPVAGVDTILQNINSLKNSSFPWYYSDMVPQGGSYTTITYNVVNARQTQYEIQSLFDNTQLSNRAVIVYVNGVQQTLGIDYTFSKISPAVLFIRSFVVGDKIVIRDYSNTDGNYIPETPSKLGLYPKFEPHIFVDTTYQTPTAVLQGHDGSITPAFGDFRDDFLLELEKRIYNNIKADYNKNSVNHYDTIPGRFRKTNYTLDEFNGIMAQNFLNWAGSNNVDYSVNKAFDINNSWTWNYKDFTDVIDGSTLQGSWRAIYNYWFDTITPNLTPWEMLGFGSKPSWWENRYGPAPYTSGNVVLWEDLEAGYIYGEDWHDSRFARPGLTGFIPVDDSGNLLNPTEIPLIALQSTQLANSAFAAGEQGPAETAWRRSSDYPYAIQLLTALAKPAEYFSTQLDISRFYKNTNTGQWTNSVNQKISPKLLAANGDATTGTVKRTSGYINWIGDNIKNFGIDPIAKLNEYFGNLSVQLNYKVGGFTDKKIISVSAEQTSPGSKSGSVIIPDTNYNIYLNKSVPVSTAVYSAVIVTKTTTGYSVSGYDPTNPFFTIIPSIANNNSTTITINQVSVKLYQDSAKTTQVIPYGTEFATIQQVADFLISYERHLVAQGFVFNTFNSDLETQQNWTLSVQELIHWGQQGWAAGTIILLNPVSTNLILLTKGTVVDEVNNISNGNKVLNQDFLPIKNNNFNILRFEDIINGNRFTLTTLDGSSICYGKFNLIQYEHVLVVDNVSDFGDIVYVPSQGTRQFRLKLSGSKTGAWTGALSAPGYIYNNATINNWQVDTDYRMGDVVKHNNFYYTASQDIAASATFSPISWTRINSADIQTGLLPSFSQLAQQFEHIYDVDNPPADEAMQEFSAGLIGFRQRQYLTDLGISIPTQTKFYQGFIKEKGSLNSINALTKADFNNVTGNIDIFEEWAFRVGQYGGLNSNVYREFVLDQSVFNTNPVAFTLTDHYDTTDIIANLTLANVYNSSNIYNASTTIYTNRTADVHDTDLPPVGYVNLNDVDYTVFDITNFNQPISALGAGDKVWTAKNTDKNWDILRVNETHVNAISLTYILDTHAELKFDRAHSFVAGDSLVLKYFNDTFDGVYQVVSTNHPTTVNIQISNIQPTPTAISPLQTLIRAMTITGSGTVYAFDSARVSTINDFVNTPAPLNGWMDNDHIWVDTATANNGWGVYTFNRPWLSNASANVAHTITTNAQFGSAVKISYDNNYAYIGAPGSNKVFANVIGTGTAFTISNVDAGFGTTIDTTANIIAVGSTANVHVYNTSGVELQKITSANVSTITSISLSTDGHWLYVGGGIDNTVEAYYTASNTAPHFSWAKKITSTGSFGNVVQTNTDGTVLFVGAPNATNVQPNNGNVYVYTKSISNVFTLHQTLSSQHKNDSANFGASLAADSALNNLYIGAPNTMIDGVPNGVVERWVLSGSSYVFDQLITHPNQDVGQFGGTISVSNDGVVLAIGSQGSPSEEHTTFDNSTLNIDSNTTHFVEYIFDSGVVYMFEAVADETSNTSKYVYVQELEVQLHTGDAFGSAIDASRGIIVVGAPGAINSAGTAYTFANDAQSTAWTRTRQQEPRVDIDSISRTFIYNKSNNNILAALDFIDPIKGKVLNSVAKDIDFQLDRDPALYNQGTGTVHADLHWGPREIGRVWWNLDTVRYIDYEQDSLSYRLNHWGNRFPGSSIDVYEWVESTVLPSQYTGTGKPLHADDSAYSTYGYVDSTGAVKLKYYFWVAGLDTVNVKAGKSNSVYSIAAAIENPLSQGLPYATILRDDTIALYNVNHLLIGQSSVVQLGSQVGKPTLIHSEYALIQEGNPRSEIPTGVLLKFVDSLSGVDQLNNPVPDTNLPVSQRYGIEASPRQSMIVNRSLALSNYLTLVNRYLAAYPVIERKVLTTLNSSEPIPNTDSGWYDLVVNTADELEYINADTMTANVSQVLVLSDSTQFTKWAIYKFTGVANGKNQFSLLRIQSYKTNSYWSYTDWYDASYNATSTPDIVVNTNLDFGKLNLVAGTHVKVLNNGNNQFVVYYIDSKLNKNLVGIENGTVQITTGAIPNLELRQILLAMQNEIFIDDLAVEYNKIFFTMIKYILTEQKNLDWVFKTSFVGATQNIRKLEQFPAYIPDNQDFYKDYIDEVKPYRTVVREFVVDYLGNDSYNSDVTDFDLPPYWDPAMGVYRSPTGEQSYDANLLSATNSVYSQWYNNYKYSVVSITVEDPGTGYAMAPQIIISGGGGTGATAYAGPVVNGGLTEIFITNPGKNYTSTPKVIINGVGSGARAQAVLKNIYDNNNTGHNLVRSIKATVKFDRVNYVNANTFVFWDNITTANVGQTIPNSTIVVLNDMLYKLSSDYTIPSNVEFPFSVSTTVEAKDFDNANDRIIAFNGNLDLRNVDDGLDYPGVKVDGNSYVGTTYDTHISSKYTDVIGIAPGDINVDGGAYYDRFNSHAPEELVPGRMYDSLNMSVYDTNQLAFRFFDTMNQERQYYRIALSNTTTLSANLSLTDEFIYVNNIAALPDANPTSAMPGVVFINGEKITYYVRDVANNRLGQLRRAVDGTSPQYVHTAGSLVVDSSVDQKMPDVKIYQTKLNTSKQYKTADITTLGLSLTANITANIGDVLTQVDSGTGLITASMRVLESVVDSKLVPVLTISGGVTGLPEVFDSELGFAAQGADNERIASATAPAHRPGDVAPTWVANTVIGGEILYYSGNIYKIHGNVYGATFSTPTVSANVAISPELTAEFAYGTTVANLTLQTGDQWWNTTNNKLYQWDGSTWNLYTPSNPGVGFDDTASPVYINGVVTGNYIMNSYILGKVDINGTVSVPSGATLAQGNLWYSRGTGTAADGTGINNSTTTQVLFLKDNIGFTPTPGTTP